MERNNFKGIQFLMSKLINIQAPATCLHQIECNTNLSNVFYNSNSSSRPKYLIIVLN